MGNIDKIVLSSNEDRRYFGFWKYVAQAYKKMFPEVEVCLALLTNRKEDDPVIKELREYGTVKLYEPVSWLPEFGQAKMIRFLMASEMGEAVCYIDDVDLFPLSKEFITDKTDKRPKDHLLCVGGEVYGNNGCYPLSQLTSEGYNFKKVFNPNNLDYENLMEWYYFTPVMFDVRENIGIINNFAKDLYFSDERLIRRLRQSAGVPVFEQPRGYANYLEATLDRAKWELNEMKLYEDKYVNAHCSRPADPRELEPLLDYINKKYAD